MSAGLPYCKLIASRHKSTHDSGGAVWKHCTGSTAVRPGTRGTHATGWPGGKPVSGPRPCPIWIVLLPSFPQHCSLPPGETPSPKLTAIWPALLCRNRMRIVVRTYQMLRNPSRVVLCMWPSHCCWRKGDTGGKACVLLRGLGWLRMCGKWGKYVLCTWPHVCTEPQWSYDMLSRRYQICGLWK